ncbi:fused acetyl/propionyl-CoA carboxylase subunit alpha/methylmalonyl-CoA decarboxylase subunit alpha [Ornithinimicrobium faecis]|uniref:Fused acetyl/propionyl-CoA carboxylase subunit alpha/methylmalonyl-CoA decarboxylase subunit alpha n=1 Tax=Ornithinimicrobium faecis TaxID=2934158 RepID=A0ABY4YSD8_9MICO|nr:carboxyl transferase domain-containing protein [Ornithinimicrobium sp. HY1793]USQ79410.1 fused acetyl/propionyl-CoA carboxylase subunit alpha/methylmalonyl-CoA decarboxylase subunit alpha [Ornithinimicrobium sp. HY1793]
MFSRIAIVNRGEAAVRLIHAVRDHNAAGGPQLQTIALFTDADRRAMFVREADIAHSLGPASARPYLDLAVLERALVETGADAVWVGWGFVAEDPAFVDLCDRLGITFIGPSADAMRKLGDKIGSKLIAEEVGVPVAPWSRSGLDTLEDAVTRAAEIGYPLMLKATAGGGGRGIRKVTDEGELRDVYQRTRDEAERAFGSGVVFLESLVTDARHVEVQVIADSHGTAWAIGVRDCSVQRRNQKIIEESASPLLTAEQSEELKAAAERLVLAVGYEGAGTVEFLYRPQTQQFAFLEVNTRLQVEHPITESTTGLDLVRAQLHVAAGGHLEGERPTERGHAVEARLNAEDPDRDFAPAPGRITLLEFPTGPGIRVDTGVGEGDSIPADFDSMIAKIIAYGRDRAEALSRLRRAVGETTVVIEGGATNKSFVLQLLQQPEVVGPDLGGLGAEPPAGGHGGGAPVWCDTGWIDRVRAEGRLVSHQHSGVALVQAGIDAYMDEVQVEVRRLLETARGGRPQVQHQVGRPVDLKLRGVTYQVTAVQTGPHQFRVTVAGGGQEQTVTAEVERLGQFHGRLTVNGRRHRIVSAIHGPTHLVEVDEVIHRVSRDEGGIVRAPSPALVVATPVAVGDEVAAGAQVLVLEAMKMETVIQAPFAARVRELLVRTGSQVETGAPLVRLEPTADAEADGAAAVTTEGPDLDLPPAPEAPSLQTRADGIRAALVSRVLGYDVPVDDDQDLLPSYLAARTELRGQGVDVLEGEMELLATFADLAELSRNRPSEAEERTELRVHSPREHFHTYLQSLDVERGALPEAFSERLRQVVSHYGVSDLERSEDLEDAVFRVFLAQQRSVKDLQVVTAVLQAWLGEPPPPNGRATEARLVLERLVRATQLRHPAISDMARSIRFRWFDQQLVAAVRASALEGLAEEVAALAEAEEVPDRAARIEEIVAIPVQIAGILSDRLEQGTSRWEPLLEVLVRRHYREFDLHDVTRLTAADRELVLADYVLDDRPTRLITTVGTLDELRDPGSALVAALTEQAAAGRQLGEVVMDLYLRWPDMPESSDEASAELAGVLAGLGFPVDCRRVAVGGCPGGGREVDYLTFRPDDQGGTHEDTLVRGVHPMVGRRLDLWRLREFDITRIEAPDDVLLYECVAPDNPADRRLVALAQVRQLSVIRDENGAVVSLPQGERAVESCLEAIRRARTKRGAEGVQLDTNHVWVQVWPVIEATPAELATLQHKITPLTERAGLEEVVAQGRVARPDGTSVQAAIRFHAKSGAGVVASFEAPPTEPLKPLDDYGSKVLRARRRGLVYPYELADALTGEGGTLVEHDLDETGALVPVDRPHGLNTAGIIVAVVTTPTDLHPEGVTRVVLCGDPIKALGALSEPECTRVIAAIDLAEEMGVPLEWFAVSAGARISMDSGTENMDWVAAALKRIVEFTQAGGEINVVVAGINVGAQPYWNAEATMLMHTKGILVMTPDSAMVLTGKQSLDFSGGVSAEDNHGIGGYDRVMGPNGQAQYWARDLAGAVDTLMAHYEHTYTAPGEPGPRRVETSDPADRDLTAYPHSHPAAPDFATVGDIFSAEKNPDRKKAFDIRTVMAALVDQDHPTLERWAGMADADTAVVQDAHIGGHSVALLGIESRPVPRHGFPPTDGPDTYTAGTLFPRSSKKAARAINAASGNRPLVVLANLSGFDGSPDSMRHLQLEYGAEIGRAIVNFDGPIVFCVISRYHGGAFVVFSKRLNPRMTVLAIEGSFASVLGGAPAAAVVFAGEVEKRAAASPEVKDLQERINAASQEERAALMVELADVRAGLRSDKISEVAAEFDGVHNIHRAVEVGSVDAVIAAADLRPEVIRAIEGHQQT